MGRVSAQFVAFVWTCSLGLTYFERRVHKFDGLLSSFCAICPVWRRYMRRNLPCASAMILSEREKARGGVGIGGKRLYAVLWYSIPIWVCKTINGYGRVR